MPYSGQSRPLHHCTAMYVRYSGMFVTSYPCLCEMGVSQVRPRARPETRIYTRRYPAPSTPSVRSGFFILERRKIKKKYLGYFVRASNGQREHQACGLDLCWPSAQHLLEVYRAPCICTYDISSELHSCQISVRSKPVVRAIEVSHAACKDKFRLKPSLSRLALFFFSNIPGIH